MDLHGFHPESATSTRDLAEGRVSAQGRELAKGRVSAQGRELAKDQVLAQGRELVMVKGWNHFLPKGSQPLPLQTYRKRTSCSRHELPRTIESCSRPFGTRLSRPMPAPSRQVHRRRHHLGSFLDQRNQGRSQAQVRRTRAT